MAAKGHISIWFFIGGLLAIYGALIAAAGIYGLWHPPQVVLANLHAGVWWGGLLLGLGLFYLRAFRPRPEPPRGRHGYAAGARRR